MILGALVALGVKPKELIEQLNLLNIEGWKIDFSIVERSGISATKAIVKIPHEHSHRHLRSIIKIIEDSGLSKTVKSGAIKIFTHLAEAEAKVHGIPLEKVHFHEVGALDAIIDIVGACVGFEMLEIKKFACSRIHVGSGFVKMAHGKFPVPPPAVAELLQNVSIYSTEIEGELVTPTGAAIISTVCKEFGSLPEMRVEKTGYGAGTREYKDFPNVLRLMLGEFESELSIANENLLDKKNPKSKIQNPKSNDNLLLLETNIDDLSPQVLGFVLERAFELGALDFWMTPIQMKKNRPATMVSVLCDFEKKEVLSELLFTETTTLGIRVREIERNCLARETVNVKTEFGAIDVKIARYNGKIANAKPEYEQIRRASLKSKIPLHEVERKVLEKFRKEQEDEKTGKKTKKQS